MALVKAVCVLKGSTEVTRTISFIQEGTNPTTIEGEIKGLTLGKHGLHIHAVGDTTNGCNYTGPHFNPSNVEHGDLEAKVWHAGDLGNLVAGDLGNLVAGDLGNLVAGDLGNLVAGDDGIAKLNVKNNLLDLSGDNSALGRALVVHADPDDLGLGGHEYSKLTGNAGARIACGIIGLA